MLEYEDAQCEGLLTGRAAGDPESELKRLRVEEDGGYDLLRDDAPRLRVAEEGGDVDKELIEKRLDELRLGA